MKKSHFLLLAEICVAFVSTSASAQYSGAPANIVGWAKGSVVGNSVYSGTPFAAYLATETDGLGRDSELEETPQNLLVQQLVSHTLGTVYGQNATQYCNSPGDCIPYISEAYSVGVVAAQNEGLDWHIRLQENGYVFQGVVTSFSCSTSPVVCTWGLNQTQGLSQQPYGTSRKVGIQLGDGLQLIDITNGYSVGSVSNIPNAGGPGCCGPTVTGSGVNWDSTFGDTFAKAVTSAAIDNGGGANIFPRTNVTVSTGTWTGTFTVSSTPVCFFDETDSRYQCAKITAVTANASITVDRLQWPITAGAAVDQGGLTGYCFGMDLDIVSSGNYNGYGDPTDSQVVNPIRRCQPIQYNTAGNTLTVYVNADGEAQFTTRANPAVSGSGAYHIYPAAMTESVLNASSGNVDGGNLTTTPYVGTFAVGDTVEQPHYYAQKGGNLNWNSNSWASMPGWGSSFGFAYGGSMADGGAQGTIQNSNSPTVYYGLPSGLSQAATPGLGTLVTPKAVSEVGPYSAGVAMNIPPLGQYSGMGALYVGCGASSIFCSGWNAPMWMVTAQNDLNWPYGEDSIAYNPTTQVWSLSAGGTGPNGNSSTCTQSWGPAGWTQSGSGCGSIGTGKPVFFPTQTFTNLSGGFTVAANTGGIGTNNTFAQGFTDLNDGGYSWATLPGKDSSGHMWRYHVINSGGGGGDAFCTYNTASGPVTVTTPSQLQYCHYLPASDGIGASDTISTVVTNPITSATASSGITTPSCNTGACSNISGTYQITSTTFTTGTVLTLVWPATPTAYRCWAAQNGGAAFYGVGHSVATTTGMTIGVGASIVGATVQIDYGCSAN